MAFTLELGAAAPDFDLPGVDGARCSLGSFAGAELLTVVFACNHCPHVIGTEQRINQLYADYQPRGMALVSINSNETDGHPTDSFEHMRERAAERGFRFPYVRDEDQSAALAYGALRTPHFYLFDRARRLRYTGRLDDNTLAAERATSHELRDAIEALLAGAEVPVPLTNPIGCNVKWKNRDHHWMPPEACDLV
jgi:peroxiredoxin